jgi:penicillin-binding protein 1A
MSHETGRFKRLPFHIRMLLLAPIVAASLGAAVMGGFFLYYTFQFPDPLSMRPQSAGPVIRILARDGKLLDERGARRDYMPLDLLPRRVPDAVLATEDRRFFDHPGLDPLGMIRAFFANLRAGRYAQGGSTLTQQLAKNLFLSPERTLSRKLQELVLALWLELRISKRDILELYLNRVYFGGGAHGIEAAAHRYFGKSARDLSLPESAVIAGLLKAPSKYAPSASPIRALARGRLVLAKMREAGFITEAEEHIAKTAEIRFSGKSRLLERSGIGYAIDKVMEKMPTVDPGAGNDIVVDTTIDARLQQRTSEIVKGELAQRGAKLEASQAATVVLASDGAIRALVGGRSYADSQYNRAVRAHRQPGSAFKPLVYLAALEKGRTPNSIVTDEPLRVGAWAPKNESGRYQGPVTLRTALSRSINTVAVRLLLDAGASRVMKVSRRLGVASTLRQDASLALGTSEVTLMELAGAYNTFANGGYTVEPYTIRRVRSSTGRTLYTRPAPAARATVAAKHVAQMNDMLHETVASGSGRRAAISGHAAAGKTGTTQDYRDAWFLGYTARLTAGVWVGNDDGTAMNRVMGSNLPADIWRKVMTAAHAGLASLPLSDGRPAPGMQWHRNGGSSPVARSKREDPLARLVKETAATPRAGTGRTWTRTQTHPRNRIDADFIDRVTKAGTLKSGDLGTRRPGAETGVQRITVRPPPG